MDAPPQFNRVTGMEPGLYFLLRAERDLPALQQKCHRHFLWSPVDEALPLYLLQVGDFPSSATSVSCQQSIAGDGAFSLGMIARFREELETAPYRYRHLFWETGMIGQVLYLEAEAQGVRATGIGCFFDDPVHKLMGLPDSAGRLACSRRNEADCTLDQICLLTRLQDRTVTHCALCKSFRWTDLSGYSLMRPHLI